VRIQERPRLFEKDAKITIDTVMAKFAEVSTARGKGKTSDRYEMVESLIELMNIAVAAALGPAVHVKLLLAIIDGTFDYNVKLIDSMPYDLWRKTIDRVNELLAVLESNPNVLLKYNLPDDMEKLTATAGDPPTVQLQITGSLVAILQRLDDEFTKILQQADCHSNDYIEK
jgi:translation initiation factor 3 subunit C